MGVTTDKHQLILTVNGKAVGNTLKDLDKAAGQLRKEIRGLEVGSQQWIDKTKEYQSIQKRIKEVRVEVEGVGQNMNKGAGFLGKFGTMAKAAAAAFLPLIAVGQLIQFGKALLDVEKHVTKLQGTIKKMTGAQGKDLEELTARVEAISTTFEKGNEEVIKTANVLSKHMNISVQESLALIEKGLLAGADINGDFLEQISEYAPHFKEAGLAAEDFIAELVKAESEGIFSDKGADVVKEFNLRIREQTKSTREALIDAFGDQFATEILTGVNNGSMTTIDALKAISKEMNNTSIPASKLQTVIADVFGGPGEDAGLKYLQSLQNIGGSLDNMIDSSNALTRQQQEQLESQKELSLAQQEYVAASEGAAPLLEKFYNTMAVWGLKAVTTLINSFKSLKDIQAEVLKSAIPEDVKAGMGEITHVANKLIEDGMDRLGAYQAALKAYTANSAIDLENYQKKLQSANTEEEIERIKGLIYVRQEELKQVSELANKEIEKILQERQNFIAEEEKLRLEDLENLKKQQKEKEKEAERHLKELQRQREQEEKDRIEAQKNITALSIQLIRDEEKQKIIELQNRASNEIQVLKGTEEQKAIQEELIQEKLQRDIDRIRLEAAEKRGKAELDLKNRSELAKADLEIIHARKNTDALIEASLNKLYIQMEIELQNTELLEEEKLLIYAEYALKKAELEDQLREERKARDLEVAHSANELITGGLQAIADFDKIKTDEKIANAEKEKNARIKKLDQQLSSNKISQEGYDYLRQQAEEESAKKVAKLKTKQAQQDKQLRVQESIIAGLLAVVKALPSPYAIVVGALAALTTARIIATPIPEFRKGGWLGSIWKGFKKYAFGGPIKGPSHEAGGIKLMNSQTGEIQGEIEGNEFILNSGISRNPSLLAEAFALNERAKKFADGGPINPLSTSANPVTTAAQGVAAAAPVMDMTPINRLAAGFESFREEISDWQRNLTVNNNLQETESGLNTLNELRERNKF